MTSVNLRDLYKATGGGTGAEPVPEGTYDLEVTSAKAKLDKAQVMPVFKVVGGPNDGQKVLAGVFSFGDETAAGIAFQNLRGFGFGSEYFEVNGLEELARDLVGRRGRALLDTREWPKGSGQYRNGIVIGKVEFLGQAPAVGVPGVAAPAPGASPIPVPVPALQVAPPAPDTALVAAPPQPELTGALASGTPPTEPAF